MPSYAVVTNCTYDGFCYNVDDVVGALGQGALLNVHDFNDVFMMHSTTSPYYPIIASIDVAGSMMEAAVAFRKAVFLLKHKFEQKGGEAGWFFDVLQPREVTDLASRPCYCFEDAPMSLLSRPPEYWRLDASETRHGFAREDIKGTDCMLDPVKVTITSPGVFTGGNNLNSIIVGSILIWASNFLVLSGARGKVATGFSGLSAGLLSGGRCQRPFRLGSWHPECTRDAVSLSIFSSRHSLRQPRMPLTSVQAAAPRSAATRRCTASASPPLTKHVISRNSTTPPCSA